MGFVVEEEDKERNYRSSESEICLAASSPPPVARSSQQQTSRTAAIEKFACRLILLIALLLHLIVIQQEKIRTLTKQLEYARELLLQYENSNSPPSRNSLIFRALKKERKEARKNNRETSSSVTRKPRRKIGHQGVTQIFEPTERVVHAATNCPKCDSKNLSVTKKENVRE